MMQLHHIPRQLQTAIVPPIVHEDAYGIPAGAFNNLDLEAPVHEIPSGTFWACAREQFSIERVSVDDLDKFRDLMLKVLSDFTFRSAEQIATDIAERTLDHYRACMNNPNEWVLLAAKTSDGEIVGVLEATVGPKENAPFPSVGHINWTNVLEDYRGRGIAPMLKGQFESILRDLGVPAITSVVHKQNHSSIRANKKSGMQQMDPGGEQYVFFKRLSHI